jgi:hypothetical protein
MATRLKKLRINRVDVVDKGANAHATIALYKRDEAIEKEEGYDHDSTPRTVNQIMAEREARDQWYELMSVLECSVREIVGSADPAEVPGLLTQTVNEFSAAAKDLIPRVSMSKGWQEAVDAVEKAGRVIAGQRLTRIKDAIAALQQIVREAEPEREEPDMADADVAKRAAEAEARVKELEAQVAKAEDVTKRLEAAETRAQEAEAVAKRNQERLEEREYIEKAQRYSALPIKAEEDWKVLKAIDGMEPSVRDRALELLGAAEGQLALAGALTSVGRSGEGRGRGGTAWDEARALAEGLIAKSAGMTQETAINQVWRDRPDLYERHRKESIDRY